jgi:hypothetical protein
MENKNERFEKTGIRDPNPCISCKREWKKPGCHDTCPDRKPWLEELERVNKARREYDSTRYNKYRRD